MILLKIRMNDISSKIEPSVVGQIDWRVDTFIISGVSADAVRELKVEPQR